MNINEISFSLAEKLAIVNTLNSLILADGTVHDGELNLLSQLMQSIGFDSNFILQARNISTEQAGVLLKQMPENKKIALAQFLEAMAISDGYVHPKESNLIENIFSTIELLELQD